MSLLATGIGLELETSLVILVSLPLSYKAGGGGFFLWIRGSTSDSAYDIKKLPSDRWEENKKSVHLLGHNDPYCYREGCG